MCVRTSSDTAQSAFLRECARFMALSETVQKDPSLLSYLSCSIAQANLQRQFEVARVGAEDLPSLERDYTAAQRKAEELYRIVVASMKPSLPCSDAIEEEGESLISLSYREKCLYFGDSKSHFAVTCLDLSYPCHFEFGGIVYPSALHAFIAQMYAGQRDLQERCSRVSGDELLAIAAQQGAPSPHWNREEVMSHVLKAKFGQNPLLLDHLLSTLGTYLAATSSPLLDDRFWCEGSTGEGENALGRLLMDTRGHYGGFGSIPFPSSAKESFDAIIERKHSLSSVASLNKTDAEIMAEIDELNSAGSSEGSLRETNICRREENRAFNRFNHCNLVFDKTLVPLSTGRYINANYLYNKLLIGTQSPLPHTREDFWQMVLEEKSAVIVMLNYQVDFGGHTYFPERVDAPHFHGAIEVHLLEAPTIETNPIWRQSPFEEEYHAIKRSVLEVRKGESTHRVVHLHYLNWRDFGVGHPDCVARLVSKTKEEQGTSASPVVVHCVAGVGRTAVFASVYEQHIKWGNKEPLDVKQSVREQRSPGEGRFHRMVQAKEQYKLCYTALRALIHREEKKGFLR